MVPSEANSSSGESSGAVVKSGAKKQALSVPFLDEDVLSSTSVNTNYVDAGAPPLVQGPTTSMLYDVTRATSIPTLPVASRTLKLEELNGHGVNETADSMAYLMLQQHQQQQQQALAAQLEQDYIQTRSMLQHCSHNVLLAVLLSLLDDYPTELASTVRARVEAVLTSRMAAMAAAGVATTPTVMTMNSPVSRTPHARRVSSAKAAMTPSPSAAGGAGAGTTTFVPNSAAAPWAPTMQNGSLNHMSSHVHHNGSSSSNIHPITTNNNNINHNHNNNNTASSSPSSSYHPPSSAHRRTRGGGNGPRSRGEEQEMCSVHHCLRSLKHLQLNASTGQHECVHGFHCLVDTPVAASASASRAKSAAAQEAAGYSTASNTTMSSTVLAGESSMSHEGHPLLTPASTTTTKLIDVEAMLMKQQQQQQTQTHYANPQSLMPMSPTAQNQLSHNGSVLPSPQSRHEVSAEGQTTHPPRTAEPSHASHSLSPQMYNGANAFSQVHDVQDTEDDVKLDYSNLMNLLQTVRDLDKGNS